MIVISALLGVAEDLLRGAQAGDVVTHPRGHALCNYYDIRSRGVIVIIIGIGIGIVIVNSQ